MNPMKKMGRPTDSPKNTQFSVRFDSETLQGLDIFCAKNGLTRPQGIREAVKRLPNEK